MRETNGAPPAEAPASWILKALTSWVERGTGSVSLTLECAAPEGDRHAAEAERQRLAFEKNWVAASKKLDLYWSARRARQDAEAARERRAQVRAELEAAELEALDLADGALGRMAARRADLRAQAELLDARLPKLTQAEAAAAAAFEHAAVLLKTKLRSEATAAAQARLEELLAGLTAAAGPLLGGLLSLGELLKALRSGALGDASDGAVLTLAELPPPPAAPVRLLERDPGVPDFAYQPAPVPRK